MVQGRLGEAGPRQLAVGELHAVETASLQIGVREIAVAEEDIRELRVPEHAPGEATTGKAAPLHGEVLADEGAEPDTAESGADNLFVEEHPGRIGGGFGFRRQLRAGDFHKRILFELLQR